MKKVFIILFIFFIACTMIHSSETDQDELLKDKKKYTSIMIAGIVLTSVGSLFLTAGITMGIILQIDPYAFPFALHYIGDTKNGSVEYHYEFHFNPVVLAFNLTGMVCLAVGIPLLAVGGAKRKRTIKKMNALLEKAVIPDVSYCLNDNTIYIGGRYRF
jgi:hypothetical protein